MEKATIVLGGDVMLGRNVGEKIMEKGVDYPMGKLSKIFDRADLSMVNLECAITSSKSIWKGEAKAFYFGAPVEAVHALEGVDLVSLANNHVLDFDDRGLEDTLRLLRDAGIGHAGAGRSIADAESPAFAERNGIRFGMVAYCDHQADFAAKAASPGINHIDLCREESALARFRADLEKMGEIDWPILSLHWGPNMVHRPSKYFERLAREAIDMGYGMIYGHSAHVFHGVEIRKGRPIFYSCGDLVDDYRVDPEFANDQQLLFEMELTRTRLESIRIHPVLIEDCRAIPARGGRREAIVERFKSLCREMGTEVIQNDAAEIIPAA